jgi:hypothetical protein
MSRRQGKMIRLILMNVGLAFWWGYGWELIIFFFYSIRYALYHVYSRPLPLSAQLNHIITLSSFSLTRHSLRSFLRSFARHSLPLPPMAKHFNPNNRLNPNLPLPPLPSKTIRIPFSLPRRILQVNNRINSPRHKTTSSKYNRSENLVREE